MTHSIQTCETDIEPLAVFRAAAYEQTDYNPVMA